MRHHPQEYTPLYGSRLDAAEQRSALLGGDVPVAVYGLGKMGLPLAAVLAETTGSVVGADIDESVVAAINEGRCPVNREPGLPEAVARTVADGSLEATQDPAAAARRAGIHVVIVPTLVDGGSPDLSPLRAAIQSIADGLAPGDLVCVESTVPPGTCRDVVVPALERATEFELGDFGVAFCPERTASGRALRDIRGAYPKVVGGVDAESTRAAALLYDEVTDNDLRVVSDVTTAETVKVFEGVYRDVNIALANELGTLADELGIDVTEAIAAANSQPFCNIHDPGAGVGGHCIPYYPYFLIDTLETGTPLLGLSRRINDTMPAYTVAKLWEALADAGLDIGDATVAVLGVAYRPGVNETRESPGLAILDLLAEMGVDVVAVDPVVDTEPLDVPGLAVSDLPESDPDAVVLATAHEEFEAIGWDSLGAIIVDGRGFVDRDATSRPVYAIGEPGPD